MPFNAAMICAVSGRGEGGDREREMCAAARRPWRLCQYGRARAANLCDKSVCAPAHATTLRLALFIVAREKDILVDNFFMASTPVIGTMTALLSTSGMLG